MRRPNPQLPNPKSGPLRRLGRTLTTSCFCASYLNAAALALTGLLLLATPLQIAKSAEPDVDPATGFRLSNYRAPVPPSVPGGTVITLEELEQKQRNGNAILLDVMAAEGAGADPATGVWLLTKPRRNKAGSTWLPDVGRGVLSPTLEAYFQDNLARLTSADKARPIIIYCQADCWMSWNAVKRAASYGYTALYWYPDGTDGMRDWDVPLVDATPVPMRPQAR